APNGKTLATGTQTNVIYLHDMTTGRALHQFRGHEGWVNSVVFAADGRRLVSASNDKTVRVWDLATRKELRRLDESHSVMALALAPDGKTLATTVFYPRHTAPLPRTTVRLRDAATGKELRHFRADLPIFDLVFAPDSKTLVALERPQGHRPTSTIHLWDVV